MVVNLYPWDMVNVVEQNAVTGNLIMMLVNAKKIWMEIYDDPRSLLLRLK